jgi:hypothetical protein
MTLRSKSWRTRRVAIGVVACWLLAPATSEASLPIPFAYTVCIAGGKLVSGGQSFAPREWNADVPLAALEGKTVRIEGALSPVGFYASKVEVIADSCRPELQKSEALCNPCMTTLPDLAPPPKN